MRWDTFVRLHVQQIQFSQKKNKFRLGEKYMLFISFIFLNVQPIYIMTCWEKGSKVFSLLNDHPFNDTLLTRKSSCLYSQALAIAGEMTTRELFPRLQLTSCPLVASGRLSSISSVTSGQEISAATIFQTRCYWERERENLHVTTKLWSIEWFEERLLATSREAMWHFNIYSSYNLQDPYI